jgi:hypothetical protein
MGLLEIHFGFVQDWGSPGLSVRRKQTCSVGLPQPRDRRCSALKLGATRMPGGRIGDIYTLGLRCNQACKKDEKSSNRHAVSPTGYISCHSALPEELARHA